MSLDIPVIQSSFEGIATQGSAIIARFYEVLWDRYPEMKKSLGSIDAPAQRIELLFQCTRCIEHLDQLESIESSLHDIGAGFREIGITNEHYARFGECLMVTLHEYFGDDWAEQDMEQWMAVYTTIAHFLQKPEASTTQAKTAVEPQQNQEPTSKASTHTEPNMETTSQHTATTATNSATEHQHQALLELIRQKAQEQARIEVQNLWDKAFEEAVHEELQQLIAGNSAA